MYHERKETCRKYIEHIHQSCSGGCKEEDDNMSYCDSEC